MKKKIVAFALVIAMLAICVGATLAYFTDTETAKNVMTVGNVDIEQNEWQRTFDDNGNFSGFEPFEQNKILLPIGADPAWADTAVEYNGDSFKVFSSENIIDKIVTVTNNGNSAAFVRTIVAIEAGESADEANTLWYDNIAVTDNSDNGATITCEDNDLYVQIGDKFYIIVVYTYEQALAAGAESGPSLTGVGLYANTTKETLANFDGDMSVLVLSQAVQAADMGSDAGAALDKAFGDVDATNVADWFKDVA